MEIITILVICYFYHMFTELIYDPSDDPNNEHRKEYERLRENNKKKEIK